LNLIERRLVQAFSFSLTFPHLRLPHHLILHLPLILSPVALLSLADYLPYQIFILLALLPST
jgi:hypothetical protein